MRDYCCAVAGSPAVCFAWGYDEEDEGCTVMKLLLLQQLSLVNMNGVRRYHVALDGGFGLYAAEAVAGLRESAPDLELHCFIPDERQATKWTPDLRERYFNVLAASDQVHLMQMREPADWGYEFRAEAAAGADALIAVVPEGELDRDMGRLLREVRKEGQDRLILISPEKGVRNFGKAL